MKNKRIIREFWEENYITKAFCPTLGKKVGGFCSLCANTGIIDTTDSAITHRGESIGKKNFCICPNGRSMSKK